VGFRFQRRIKIAPGITLVASKRGIGVSTGIPGARVSMTRQGISGHAGIPGTGLAYREKLNPKGRKRPATGRGSDLPERLQHDGQFSLSITVDDHGNVDLRDAYGDPFPESELKLVKRTFADQLRKNVELICERNNVELDSLGRVHYETPVPRAVPIFEPRTFDAPGPQPPSLRQKDFWCVIWPPARNKLESENAARQAEFEADLRAWQAERDAFASGEAERRKRETEAVLHDLEAMALTLEDHLTSIPWPRETEVDFDLGDDSRTIAVTLHLPDEDSMPNEEWLVPSSRLKVSKKKIPVTRRRGIYRDYVHGAAVRVLGEIFARLPTIEAALVTGLIPATNLATGHMAEMALYSVIARREAWANLNFDALDSIEPAETLALFQLRRSMTKTGMLKPIEAFGFKELESAVSRSL
jgi:hypothetical protein